MLYRLFTENRKRKLVEALVAKQFSGFTIYEATGYWQGKREKTLIIEIESPDNSAISRIAAICRAICGLNNQDCVMVQKINTETWFIPVSG